MASSEQHQAAYSIIKTLLILAFCARAWSVEFAGGTGEPSDPYQIATAEQLLALGSDPDLAKKHFLLVADIDLSGVTLSDPVVGSFSGTFDGGGRVIRRLSIRGLRPQGLFGFLYPGSQVRDLGLVDADVISTYFAGTLAAQSNGSVINCYSTGSVIGMGYHTGGLVGYNQGTISDSYSAVQVMSSQNVGGLAGQNEGLLSNCSSSGSVFGGTYVGGLVGENRGSISACCSSSSVTGYSEVGGLVGYNTGGIAFAYSMGDVAGGNDTGGLVGNHSGWAFSCYSAASVTSTWPAAGGLIGRASSSSKVQSCYFLSPTSDRPDNPVGIALTDTQMRQQASYAGWDFWGIAADSVNDPWFMPQDAFPVLAWQTEATGLIPIPDVAGLPLDQAQATLTAAGLVPGDISYDYHRAIPDGAVMHTYPSPQALPGGAVSLFVSLGAAYDWAQNPGDGAIAKPYQIQTAGQLELLSDRPEMWDKHFVLTADLDMIGRTYATALIAPDVNDRTSGFQGTPFTGSLSGGGHAILNLRIVSLDARGDFLGLFGMIDKPGQVTGLTLRDVNIVGQGGSGSVYVGTLAGYNAGTLTDCSATGIISAGCDRVGSLTGYNAGSVINCHTSVWIARRGCSNFTR